MAHAAGSAPVRPLSRVSRKARSEVLAAHSGGRDALPLKAMRSRLSSVKLGLDSSDAGRVPG